MELFIDCSVLDSNCAIVAYDYILPGQTQNGDKFIHLAAVLIQHEY